MLWQVDHGVHFLLVFLEIEYIELLDDVVHLVFHVVIAHLESQKTPVETDRVLKSFQAKKLNKKNNSLDCACQGQPIVQSCDGPFGNAESGFESCFGHLEMSNRS